MTKLSLFSIVLSFLMLIAPVKAQEAPAPWQDVITGQVEAFRLHDSPAALSFAGASFKENFADPEQFYLAIANWGYAPILESRSHSFGSYQLVEAGVVLQRVTFTGKDQALYEAIYQLNLEADGWRVGGVQLIRTPGVGV
ncbi:MAG: DUF4864 domain-containing protein [Hyphomicrobiales bacterium]|nr:MAG: DUF4864 domain-containing protein [Hyphomicrobiales bacterium]